MEGVVEVIKVSAATHGYNGYLGICVGHPRLLQIQSAQQQEKLSQRTIMDFLKEKAKEGSKMSAQDILAVWTKEENISTPPVSPEPSTAPETPKNSTSSVSPEASPKPAVSPETSPKPAETVTNQTATPSTPTKTSPAVKSHEKKSKTHEKKSKTSKSQPRKRSVDEIQDQPVLKSPQRTIAGTKCKGCDHKDLVPFDRSYFKPHLCQQTNYPKVCTDCMRSLLPGEDKTKHCTIKGIFQVQCCKNAINVADHHCVFALCHDCFSRRSAESRSPKEARIAAVSKKPRVLPGEVLLANGDVIGARK